MLWNATQTPTPILPHQGAPDLPNLLCSYIPIFASRQSTTIKRPQEARKENCMPSFQYLQPTEEQKVAMQSFRDEFQALADRIARIPDSRGKALALTNLEQSAFWLNKALTS